MIDMRYAEADIIYNGENITVNLEKKSDKITYNDPESGSSDDISLTICDPNDDWINGSFPRNGDKISVTIKVNNWRRVGDNRSLNCGEFIMDAPGFSGPPTKVSMKAVSQPSDGCFNSTKRTQTWENVTVQNMASEIASRSGVSIQYTAEDVKIESSEQNDQTDSDFLKKTCDEYGLSLKVYSNKIVIFDRESMKKMPPVRIIKKTDKETIKWSYKTTLKGTYTGGSMKYTDPDSEEELEAKVGTEERLLSVNGKADSQADAEKKIKAAVNKANEDETTMSITVLGDPDLVSSQCVEVSGFGVADGKYYIKKTSHTIGGGYQTTLELSKVVESL